MSEPITPKISDRICKHMNDDHAEAVLMYAQKLGNVPTATSAVMKSIDANGMDLDAKIEDQSVTARVTFEPPLKDAKDAHHTLVALLKDLKPSEG